MVYMDNRAEYGWLTNLFEMDLVLERDFRSGTGGGEIDFRRGVNDLLIDLE